jgi:hypothetical protein
VTFRDVLAGMLGGGARLADVFRATSAEVPLVEVMYSVTETHISYILIRSSAGSLRKLKWVAGETSSVVEDTSFRVRRASDLVLLFWTLGTGASYVARAGMPRARGGSEAVRGSLPPVDFLAVCMTLAISTGVSRFATESV